MYKMFLLLGFMISPLLALTIQGQNADVTITINSQEIVLKNGETKEILDGSTLCFISGEGSIKIPELKRQLKKNGQCIMLPVSNNSITSQVNSLKTLASTSLWDSSENVKHGTATKGVAEFEQGGTLTLKKEQTELILHAKEFGPLPVIAIVKNAQNQEIIRLENEDSTETLFRIPRKLLESGMQLEVFNGLDEKLISKKIEKE
ncbi:hypothetical protein SUSP_000377 [Sulfurospirillum sp. 'SP']|nr:hypothetical protein [Sulfurospirillum sp. 'SP']WNY97959.1 hypothetical protein SUSP_000377 [Sulfurospirillum sp. 'SP']